MKGRQKYQFGAHLVPKCLPEVADKLNISIGQHSFVQPCNLTLSKKRTAARDASEVLEHEMK